MKVLFICSGNNEHYEIAPFIKAQGESLEKEGVELDYFLIKGKGLVNYLRNVPRLIKHLRAHPVDVIHAHYSLCGMVAILASRKIPVIVSLMGDDALGTPDKNGRLTMKSYVIKMLTKMIQPFTKGLIAKSPEIFATITNKSKGYIIPNGIQLDKFNIKPADYRGQLGLAKDKTYVLFIANPNIPRKNVALVKKALRILSRPEVELLTVHKVPHAKVQAYLNASDVFVLCSFIEGSPNVVKEAMACNRPIVSTRVGDVEQVIGQTSGCYLSSYEPEDFARQLEKALAFSKTHKVTEGRKHLIDQGLDSRTVAWKIIDIYNSACTENKHLVRKTGPAASHEPARAYSNS